MNTKHTPGPWKVRYFDIEDKERGFFVEAKNNNMPELGYGIEIMQEDFGEHNGYPLEQREADAKLIAAAPDLLEALENLINSIPGQTNDKDWWPDELSKAVEEAAAAIQKATE